MSQESKEDYSMFNRQDETSFEDYDMERERLPSSLNSTFVGEMSTLGLLSSQENDLFDDPKVTANQQPPTNVKLSDATPHVVGSRVSSFSVLSKSTNDRKNKKAIYEFVVPNNKTKSGDTTKKQHKSRKNADNVAINASKSKLLPNLSQLKSTSIVQRTENVSKPKRGRKKNDDSKNPKNLPQSNEGIFSNLRILFIPNNIDKLRLNLMKSKVMDKGGIIEENFQTDRNVTHIITELSGKQLLTTLGILGIRKLKCFENIAIIKPDWISESIMYGKLRDVKTFAVSLTEESNNTNVASSPQNLKRPYDAEKQEKNMTNLENHEVSESPDKKRRTFSPPLNLDLKIIKEDNSSLESNINNDTTFTDSNNNDTSGTLSR
ncbi:hypothetical protein C1645_286795 [Glomus cerebriforme]|uniref:BRCT domain-containing protein n=1 Tax=Glomus cerebriforme TaxID=658196 RepID=A0A397SU13_9GLOM|nr:hypothetical protein C1645_286795 [Glomus cerebriforme]